LYICPFVYLCCIFNVSHSFKFPYFFLIFLYLFRNHLVDHFQTSFIRFFDAFFCLQCEYSILHVRNSIFGWVFVGLSVCLCVCWFVCLFVCLLVCLSVCVFWFVCLFIFLSVCLSLDFCLCLHLKNHSIWSAQFHWSIVSCRNQKMKQFDTEQFINSANYSLVALKGQKAKAIIINLLQQ
jgi:hypothetical protein